MIIFLRNINYTAITWKITDHDDANQIYHSIVEQLSNDRLSPVTRNDDFVLSLVSMHLFSPFCKFDEHVM